jgi:hypothetical protein
MPPRAKKEAASTSAKKKQAAAASSSTQKKQESEQGEQQQPQQQRLLGNVIKSFADLRAGKLKTPMDVQRLIDEMPYNTGAARCPKDAIAAGVCHCLCGGLIAAAALKALGHRPAVLYLGADDDDGHLVAIFTHVAGGKTFYGCVAKSNFAGIRYRCPVYSSIRELVMSFYDVYFNTDGARTLRRYTNPIYLDDVCEEDWETTQAGLEEVDQLIEDEDEIDLFPAGAMRTNTAKVHTPVDKRLKESGMLGIDLAGAYDPSKKK